MDQRLKLISIAVGIVYLLIIGNALYQEAADFVYGFKRGYAEGQSSVHTGEMPSLSSVGTYYLNVKPLNGLRTFPNSFINKLDNNPVKAEIEKVVVEVEDVKTKLSSGMLIADIFSILLSFFGLFVMVLIPILTFRIVRSITKDRIFDPGNIRKMRIIGYALLAFYVVDFIINFVHNKAAVSVFSLEGYSVQVDWGNTTLVLLGFVVLLFAEVLKVSLRMKEEQDLTV